jgi:hypothetical protein
MESKAVDLMEVESRKWITRVEGEGGLEGEMINGY